MSPLLPPEEEAWQSSTLLLAKLAPVLPQGHRFGLYHLSTPPTRTDALFHAPPGRQPDRTYRESHFLAVTIPAGEEKNKKKENDKTDEVIVFALEIFLFSTAYDSTFFVSKADSSGYLHLLPLPLGTPSPIRSVTCAFVGYLVEQRRRPGIQANVTLFARAQSQYLFPGSVKNPGKHVLDDRGLVKWWCRVLDPLLAGQRQEERRDERAEAETVRQGYLTIPGLDRYETRAYLPRTANTSKWTVGHPLERISHYCREQQTDSSGNSNSNSNSNTGPVPPRCLVPMYPDDPKARFRDELDDEADRAEEAAGGNGAWKSVKTLDQFWDMMAFRQECSSGRMTGFIWVVFDPLPSEREAADREREAALLTSAEKRPRRTRKRALQGCILARQPRIKTEPRQDLVWRPVSTAYYYWPPEGRGRRIVDDTDYKRAVELLLQLDFSTREKAVISTARYIYEAGMGADWRLEVVGQREATATATATATADTADTVVTTSETPAVVHSLGDLPKRKRVASDAASGAASAVHSLSSGLVRKKNKTADTDAGQTSVEDGILRGVANGTAVNTLGAGLIRKKPKQTT